MFEDRGYKRTFYSAPQSVTSLVAAFLEPSITVLVFLAVSAAFDEPIGRSDLTLCLLIFALTFPGRNRFWDRPLNTGVDIASAWLGLLAQRRPSGVWACSERGCVWRSVAQHGSPPAVKRALSTTTPVSP